jgi:hypothetical protein
MAQRPEILFARLLISCGNSGGPLYCPLHEGNCLTVGKVYYSIPFGYIVDDDPRDSVILQNNSRQRREKRGKVESFHS